MNRFRLALLGTIFFVFSCENPVGNDGDRTNPYDSEYDGPVGSITGKVIIDQKPITAGILVELRRTADVQSQYLNIAHRNDNVPDGWNGSAIPVTGGETTTASDGSFSFATVPIGSYLIRVSYANHNSAWMSNLNVTTAGDVVSIRDPIVLTERLDGKIMFISTRDGFAEFYDMNADGTQQERLTFEGIVGGQDDDIPFSALDYDEAQQKAAFIFDGEIYVFDRGSNTASKVSIAAGEYTRPNDVAWGPNGWLYYSDYTGVKRIVDPAASNITPFAAYIDNNGGYSLDVTSAGVLAVVTKKYMYKMPGGSYYLSLEGGLFSQYGPREDNSKAWKVDENGQVIVFEVGLFDALPFLIPVEQVTIVDYNADPVLSIATTAHAEFTLPGLEYFEADGVTVARYLVSQTWYNVETNEMAVKVTNDDITYRYLSFDMDEMFNNLARRNSIWGLAWSSDGTRIAYNSLWASAVGYQYKVLEENSGFTFDFLDPTTYTAFSGSYLKQEWSYYYNVNRLTVGQPVTNIYLGDISNPTYAYDSLDNFGVAQSSWGGPNDEKIMFTKGMPNLTQYARIDNTASWSDLDIWIMDASNSEGKGPQKQLTFNPNKDFFPVWVPMGLAKFTDGGKYIRADDSAAERN